MVDLAGGGSSAPKIGPKGGSGIDYSRAGAGGGSRLIASHEVVMVCRFDGWRLAGDALVGDVLVTA